MKKHIIVLSLWILGLKFSVPLLLGSVYEEESQRHRLTPSTSALSFVKDKEENLEYDPILNLYYYGDDKQDAIDYSRLPSSGNPLVKDPEEAAYIGKPVYSPPMLSLEELLKMQRPPSPLPLIQTEFKLTDISASEFIFEAGQLQIKIGVNSFTASGKLIGRNIVLTVAHALYKRKGGEEATQVLFEVKQHPTTYWSAYATRWAIPPEYRSEEDDEKAKQYDIGLLILNEVTVPSFVKESPNERFKQIKDSTQELPSLVMMSGYPAYVIEEDHPVLKNGFYMYSGKGAVVKSNDFALFYDIPPFVGMAGAALCEGDFIYGVHAYKDKDLSVGVRITPFLKEWIENTMMTSAVEEGKNLMATKRASASFPLSIMASPPIFPQSDRGGSSHMGQYRSRSNNSHPRQVLPSIIEEEPS